MRPRVFPAEDTSDSSAGPTPTIRFNEAAGIPRGRRHVPASGACQGRGFNEAAGIPRGRRGAPVTDWCVVDHGFNEAAGIPRGRR